MPLKSHDVDGLYGRLKIPEDRRITSIKQEEGKFLFECLAPRPIKKTLETGLAYGCSAAYIMTATDAPHVAIDPYQHRYDNLGVRNLTNLKLNKRLELIRLPSHVALPQLFKNRASIDFAFVDGGHLFEEIFIDWYYIDLLLNTNGLIMFHDRWLDATKTVASFIRKNRKEYREIETSMSNMLLFEKTGESVRSWKEFTDFGLVD